MVYGDKVDREAIKVDAGVTFAVTSTAAISEDAGATATFTVPLGGDALVGTNTASVDIKTGIVNAIADCICKIVVSSQRGYSNGSSD